MEIHLISGFLGSGKTTAICRACIYLQARGTRVAVITNDLGTVSTDRKVFEAMDILAKQVVKGCFSSRFEVLCSLLDQLHATQMPEVVFAEVAGSCTDVVATVWKPLAHRYPAAKITLTTLVDVQLLYLLLIKRAPVLSRNITYIFNKQLEEAPCLLVNKTDQATAEQLEDVRCLLQEAFPEKTILYSRLQGMGNLADWVGNLRHTPLPMPSSLQIDYQRYEAGTQELAWLDAEIVINSPKGRAPLVAHVFSRNLYAAIHDAGLPIGHVKFLLDGTAKWSITSNGVSGLPEDILFGNASKANLMINVRAQAAPGQLDQLLQNVLSEMSEKDDSELHLVNHSVFTPGLPAPLFRLT